MGGVCDPSGPRGGGGMAVIISLMKPSWSATHAVVYPSRGGTGAGGRGSIKGFNKKMISGERM